MNIMEQQLHKQQPDVNQVDNLPSKPPIVRGLLYKVLTIVIDVDNNISIILPLDRRFQV